MFPKKCISLCTKIYIKTMEEFEDNHWKVTVLHPSQFSALCFNAQSPASLPTECQHPTLSLLSSFNSLPFFYTGDHPTSCLSPSTRLLQETHSPSWGWFYSLQVWLQDVMQNKWMETWTLGIKQKGNQTGGITYPGLAQGGQKNSSCRRKHCSGHPF